MNKNLIIIPTWNEALNIQNLITKIFKYQKNIGEMRDLFNRGHKYHRVQLDNTCPNYILNNQNKFYKWIKQ